MSGLVVCDTNICVYRTLAILQPPIYDDTLRLTADYLQRLTNAGSSLVVTDTIASELIDGDGSKCYIVPQKVRDFCVRRLKLSASDYKIQKYVRAMDKSLKKFVDKYHVSKSVNDFHCDYKVILPKIDKMYLQHPQKLKNLTEKKIELLPGALKERKKSQRPHNLPELNDRKILAECICLKDHQEKISLFSNDGDFSEFVETIKETFGVEVLRLQN